MLWVSLALVVVLGGATVWFHSETFIKWKPSALYWAMGAGVLGQPAALRQEPAAGCCSANSCKCRHQVWQRLNLAWIAFFAAMGVLNLWVAYTFSTATWVNFKLFGALGLMLRVHGGAGPVPEPLHRRTTRAGCRADAAEGAA